ncbi:MAG: hypothetical protein JXB35_06755 [Anaerolineae bacterium]|nr:hypothetical protein [Anaerolineae bacterium]
MTDSRWVDATFDVIVIPDTSEASGLQIRIYHHDIPYYQPIPCWTYVTSGLAAHRQQEVILTIQSDPQADKGAPLRFPLEILKQLYHLARQGRYVGAWGYTSLTLLMQQGTGLPFNLAYAHPAPLEGLTLPQDALAGIFLSAEELEVYRTFGLSRLLAAHARHFHYFPYPTWSTFPAPQIVTPEALRNSMLNGIPRIHLPGAAATLEGNQVTLHISPQARALLIPNLERLQPEQPFALLPELARDIDGCFAWDPDANTVALNAPPNSQRQRIAGCYVGFVPDQPQNAGHLFEDGFMIMLTSTTTQQVRAALREGAALTFPAPEGKLGFHLT